MDSLEEDLEECYEKGPDVNNSEEMAEEEEEEDGLEEEEKDHGGEDGEVGSEAPSSELQVSLSVCGPWNICWDAPRDFD